MSTRHLPVRPDLIQLKHQAKDLLREMKRGNPRAKLADAQFALARSYGVVSWPRLVVACHVVDAIWEDDAERLRAIVTKRPALLHEMALAREGSNWGPPMSYAANLGRDRIIRMLWELGARDLAHAAGRAALQGKIDTARMIHELAGRPPQPVDAVMGPCETLNAEGLAYVLEMGAPIADRNGDWRAPVAMILETYCRKPDGKHRCLELLAGRGIALPDTPPMAVHRGRIDLLERHLHADPGLLRRTFAHAEMFPREIGCHENSWRAFHGTPLGGATLLHLCIDYGELEIAQWLIARGMDVNVRAAVDGDGFGGHTPIFSAVVSYWYYLRSKYAGPPERDEFAELLVARGADLTVRASLRTKVHSDIVHEYRDVTPLAWGEQFHDRPLVSVPAMRLLADSLR